MMWRLCGLMLALAVALPLAGCGEDEAPSASQSAMQEWVGKDFSGLKVQTLDGLEQPLVDAALLANKPVILNVWATWCAPCLVEMPTLDALGKEGKYTVVAIATDKDTQTVKDFLKTQTWGSGVEVWFDRLGSVTRREMGALGIPVTFVLNADLKVVMVEAGERDWAHPKMQAKIEKALESK